MSETQTERASCRFLVERAEGAGKYAIKLQPCHDGLSALKHTVLGFDLLSGVSAERAKETAETLNESVLQGFRDEGKPLGGM